MSKEQNAAALTTFAEAVNTENYDLFAGVVARLIVLTTIPLRDRLPDRKGTGRSLAKCAGLSPI
jgi:hypothetical protein